MERFGISGMSMRSRKPGRVGVNESSKDGKRDAVSSRRWGMQSFEDRFGGVVVSDVSSHKENLYYFFPGVIKQRNMAQGIGRRP